mmetsp:Transcript_3204/g.6716  ORF Transcript_3204/g.6716 Transcript_3204/m.6716 type:complete len:456 (+) Transcript_3204:164-1531(+)
MRSATILFLAAAANAAPVQLIIDTDLGFDVDDVGAIAVGHNLADQGYADILAIVHNTGFYEGIGGVDVINNWYGRSTSMEEGAYTGQWGSNGNQDSYTTTIENTYPSPVQNYDQVQSAVSAYTKVLQAAENNSVTIASIGELTNLRDILMAEEELFISKVKAIYYMDGSYNFGCGDSQGSGNSPWLGSTEDCDGAAQYVNQKIPSSIKQVFSGEGGDICTGGRFNDGCGDGPVKQAYQIWTNYGCRWSWDPITVYLAVMGDTSLYSSTVAGTNTVDYYGNEAWDTSNTGNNQYHVYINNDNKGDVTRILDDAMCAAPYTPSDDDHVTTTAVELTNKETGKCLTIDSPSSSPADYTNVQIGTCTEAANQLWEYDGTKITHSASGKCLDADTSNGDSVQVYSCTGASNQEWRVTAAGTIINSKSGKCLDVFGGNTADGTDVWSYTCSGSTNQAWSGL